MRLLRASQSRFTRCVTLIPMVFFMVTLWVCTAHAANVRLSIPKPAGQMGQETVAYVILEPEAGEQVNGAWITLSVNKDFVMLLVDRAHYASDPVFSKVEKFSVDPLTGSLVYRVRTEEPLGEAKVLLRVPLKFVQVGISSVTLTSSVYDTEMKRKPANSGYQRVAAYKDTPDPLLLSSLIGENTTLTQTAMTQELEFTEPEKASMALEMDLGVTELAAAESDEDADVVIEFSKREKTIGLRQWVRLDVIVTKYPKYESLGAVQLQIKYDPKYFTYTDARGQESDVVELNEVFNLGFINTVDRLKGEIDLSLGVDLLLEDPDLLKPPVNVVSLYFKGMSEGRAQTITMQNVKVPVVKEGSKMAKHDASISVSAQEQGCDSELPATLCSGSFKVAGTVTFNINNRNETQRTAIRSYTEEDGTLKQEQTSVRVKKYYLEQTWNLNMDGSFRNGVRLTGSLLDNPHTPQQLSVALIGQDTTARFGDFNTSFTDAKLVSITSSQVTGLHLEHQHKNLKMRLLTAELNSSPGESTVTGKGHAGPYNFSQTSTPIIQSSMRVYKNDEVLGSDEYAIDFARNQISFTKPITTQDKVVLKYQLSSLLFSTGNIKAMRLDYATSDDNFKVGSTYITTMSPKGNAFTKLSTSETLDINDAIADTETGATSYECGYFGAHECVELKLGNVYIVEGSIQVQNNAASNATTYTENSAYVYIDHRGYLEGRLFIDKNKFGIVNVTISYSYYNPQMITQQSFDIYEIQNMNSTANDLGRWRTDMFPGSELIYLSDNAEYDITEGQDEIVCHKDPTYELDVDSPLLCPGTYGNVAGGIDYFIEGTDNNQYVQLNSTITTKKYLKIKYTPVPPDIAGGSEFEKVVWGVDTSFNLGKKIKFNAEYAQADSDLSASFNSTTEEIFVDVRTIATQDANDPLTDTCWYVSQYTTGITDEYLACQLSRKDLFGSIDIKIQKCENVDEESKECLQYSSLERDVLIPINDIDLKEGYIYFWRSRWTQSSSEVFPALGDKFYVTYTYDQTLDRVVTGDMYFMNLDYNTKNLVINLEKRGRDPLFDNAVSSYKDNIVDKFSGDISMTVKQKWNLAYSFKDSTEEVLDETGQLKSEYDKPSSSFSVSYNSGILSSLQYTRDTSGTKGYVLNSLNNKTETDTHTDNQSLSFTMDVKKTIFTVTGSLSQNKNEFYVGSQQDTDSKSQIYGFTYNPSRKISLTHNLTMLSTSPTGNTSDARTYSVTLKTFPIVDITLKFDKNNTRATHSDEPQLTENRNYSLAFKPFWKINNFNFTFSRNDKPGGTIINPYLQRTDTVNISFNTKYKRSLTWKPSYSRTVNSKETQTWSLTRNKNWTLEYKPTYSRFNPIFTMTQNNATTISDNLTSGANTTNSTRKRTMTLNFDPTNKSSFSTSVDRTYGSTSPSKNLSFSYRMTLRENLSMNTKFTLNKSLGTTFSKTKNFDLSLSWAMDANTHFSLSYARKETRSSSLSSYSIPTVTTFSTELKTNFK